MRVLVFGDSITQGFWDIEGGWVARLRKHYDKRQLENLENRDEPTIFNLGISGDVVKGLLMRVENEVEARRWQWPDEQFTLIFAIGINDSAFRDNEDRSNLDTYQRELRALLEKAKKHSNRIMFVGLTPCVEDLVNSRLGKNKKLTNSRILEFDKILRDFCQQHKIAYVPIFEEFKSRLDAGEDLLPDGLHPNGQGHELIFQIVRPNLDKLLST